MERRRLRGGEGSGARGMERGRRLGEEGRGAVLAWAGERLSSLSLSLSFSSFSRSLTSGRFSPLAEVAAVSSTEMLCVSREKKSITHLFTHTHLTIHFLTHLVTYLHAHIYTFSLTYFLTNSLIRINASLPINLDLSHSFTHQTHYY